VGVEDRLLNRWAAQAKKLPFVPLPGGGKSKVQPVLVVDVAAGITSCIRDQGFSMGKTFELGGPDVFTINELVELMFETIREKSRVLHIPMPIARLGEIPR
jgi:NADH dehydrogenase (ubiquinone) 1 alpha subcomplex subunit 9